MNKKFEQCINRDYGYDFIRFLAMMLIVFHHIVKVWQNYNYNVHTSLLYIVRHDAISFGRVGVALFFILSGALLIKKYYDHLNNISFYKKRLVRIEVPHMIGFLCAFALQYLINPRIINVDIIGAIFSFIGLGYSGEFWNKLGVRSIWVIGEWFTAVIIFLYLIFPLMRWLFINYLKIGSFIISFIFLLNLEFEILTYHNGWFSITNGMMCFWMGMLFEKYKHVFDKKWCISLLSCVAIIYWFINPKDILGYKYLSCFVFSCLLFICLYRIKFSNTLVQFVCKYNYEIYLTHHRIFILLFPALLTSKSNDAQLVISAIFLIGITFLLSKSLQQISDRTINLFSRFLSFKSK